MDHLVNTWNQAPTPARRFWYALAVAGIVAGWAILSGCAYRAPERGPKTHDYDHAAVAAWSFEGE